jgi:hypothetical protein
MKSLVPQLIQCFRLRTDGLANEDLFILRLQRNYKNVIYF